ncbi:hypothetical protein Tco_1132734 [Tanacetum coccineum]|uniref:Uncharacterized protein n=1 Tax=Tanacetum coccineum TaxID=301880 RepID=A0ABQ5JFU8_9ASTR
MVQIRVAPLASDQSNMLDVNAVFIVLWSNDEKGLLLGDGLHLDQHVFEEAVNKKSQSVLEGGINGVEGGGFDTSLELIVAGVISRNADPELLCSEAITVSSSKST